MKCWVCETEFFFSARDAIDNARRDQAGLYKRMYDLGCLAFERKDLPDAERAKAIWGAIRGLENFAIELNLLLEEAAAGARGICGYCYNASHLASQKPFDERMEELRYPRDRTAVGQASRESQREHAARLDTPPAEARAQVARALAELEAPER